MHNGSECCIARQADDRERDKPDSFPATTTRKKKKMTKGQQGEEEPLRNEDEEQEQEQEQAQSANDDHDDNHDDNHDDDDQHKYEDAVDDEYDPQRPLLPPGHPVNDRAEAGRSKQFRSLIILSAGFWCVFTAYSCLQNIESSLNKNKTLGSTSIGVLYLVNIFVSYAAKDFVARKSIGPKRAMVLGAAQYVVFSAANLYATWYTLIPAAVLIGSGAGILWVGQGTMLSQLARKEALRRGETESKCICEFNGIFWSIFASTQVSGNLIGYVVFMFGDSNNLPISPKKIFLFVLIFSGVVGVLALQGLPASMATDKVEKSASKDEDEDENAPKKRKTYGIPSKYLPLLPLFFFSGMYSAFEWGVFTTKVIKHSYGKDSSYGTAAVFLIMTVFGASTATTSITLGHLTSGLRQIRFLFVVNYLLIKGVCILFLFYHEFSKSASGYLSLGAIAIVLGYCDSVWNALISSMLGIMFPEDLEEAFSMWKVFQNIGTSLIFFIQPHVSLFPLIGIVLLSSILSVPMAVMHLGRVSKRSSPKLIMA